ncbi:MAG: hypothetical protein LUH55_09135 [Bacteroides thetaiotaomicron]|nr:hypothetical protein [Bacteroides thetaiotaomicron]
MEDKENANLIEEKNTNLVGSIFRLRENFIVLGLTGRTGSGCSTVADILSKETFDELDLRSYKTFDFKDSDERKYSVVYRFMEDGNKWIPFYVIEASTIIFSFIAEGTYKDFSDFLDQLNSKEGIEDIDKIKVDFYKAFSDSDSSDKVECWSDVVEQNVPVVLGLEKLDDYNKDKIINNVINESELDTEKEIINQYCTLLKDKKKQFRKIFSNRIFKEINKNGTETIHDLYSYVMQIAGNNIRKSGSYLNDKEQYGKEITIAERINKLIKIINRYEEGQARINKMEKRVRICIDALRNTFEIQYFKDKYRSFYAVAVITEDKDRVQRLESDFNMRQLDSLDKMEYPEERTDFYKQNIAGCLQISDIYLYNPNVSDRKYFFLTEQLIKYIALMLHPGLVAPTHLERCMQLAFNAKFNSGCLSRKVGAVVTGDDFSVRSVGWNDVPKGQIPCNLRCVEDYCRNKDDESFSEFELTDSDFEQILDEINNEITKEKMQGKTFQYCFKDVYTGLKGQKNQVHTRALHAEENAFLQIAKYGGAEIRGGKLFTTASPCELCSKKAYQLGIKEIYYIDPYPGISKTHILTFGKHDNPQMILFRGAIGDAYISLYSQRIPYKDELELQTNINAEKIAEGVSGAKKKQNSEIKEEAPEETPVI